jgi:hypothetical protein
MPWLRFETTIPVFERAKTVHATVIDLVYIGNNRKAVHQLPLARFRFPTLTWASASGLPACRLLHAVFLLVVIFYREDVGHMFSDYTALCPRR